jgi:hypothetical protein
MPKCTHLHAPNDEQLAITLLRHVQGVHPDLRFRVQDATSVVEAASYLDAKHSKKDWVDTVGDAVVNTSG